MMTLVLLPGLDGSGILFRKFRESLPGHIKTVVISLPTDKKLNYEDLTSHIHLPSGSCILLGESFSGPLAIRLAARLKNQVVGLILVATFATSPHPWIPAWLPGLIPVWLIRSSALRNIYRRFLLQRSTSRDLLADFDLAIWSVKPRVLIHRLKEVLRIDVREEFRNLAIPVIYLRGRRDWVVPMGKLAQLKTLMPRMEVQEFDGPHPVLQYEPGKTADAIAAFIHGAVESHGPAGHLGP